MISSDNVIAYAAQMLRAYGDIVNADILSQYLTAASNNTSPTRYVVKAIPFAFGYQGQTPQPKTAADWLDFEVIPPRFPEIQDMLTRTRNFVMVTRQSMEINQGIIGSGLTLQYDTNPYVIDIFRCATAAWNYSPVYSVWNLISTKATPEADVNFDGWAIAIETIP
jgi:hypothetical protein